ncbi:MAG: hypothetical protein Q4D98_02845 [Planctomycetia bacterium]|nr:hypothetical protein [Planctomycetia bacterium]
MRKHILGTLLVGMLLWTLTAAAAIDEVKKQAVLDATTDAVLIETIQQPGDDEDAIFMKMLACKRLAVIGTEKAVPALEAMLANEKLNHAARYALEAMPCEAAGQALIRAAKTLTGMPGVGCVESCGAKKLAAAVPMLKEKFQGCECPNMRKAIYAAMGMISTDESLAFLMNAMKGEVEKDPHVQMGLGDAILECANNFEKAGSYDKAVAIYDACVNPKFPVFMQKAASYRTILARRAMAGELLASKMVSPKECCFTGGLKTIREFPCEYGETITKAVLATLNQIPPQRKALVIQAVADRCDEASRKLVFPVVLASLNSDDSVVQIAAVKALGKVGCVDMAETTKAIMTFASLPEAEAARAEFLQAAILSLAALPAGVLDDTLLKGMDEASGMDVDVACAFFKIIELRRIVAAGPELVKVANRAGVDPKVRDAALYALADIVTLDKLNLLVDALSGEKNDNKASWILRSACTRLPREECAAQVVKLYDAATNADEKGKMLTLLKQIGGPLALACVEKACWSADTADMATQVLGTWNTPDDIEAVAAACLKLAKGAEERYAIRGIRSYVRIPRQFDLPAAKKFEMCKIAFDVAKRPEDKTLIFEVFKRIIDVASARAAMSYAADPAYRDAACAACVAVALKFQGQSDELKTLLNRVVAECKDAKTVADAKMALNRLDAMMKDAPLEIVSAKYGAGDQWKDVTALVKQKFNGKAALGIAAGNEAFGDAAPGKVKTTRVVVKFKATGEQRTLEFRENESLILPEK